MAPGVKRAPSLLRSVKLVIINLRQKRARTKRAKSAVAGVTCCSNALHQVCEVGRYNSLVGKSACQVSTRVCQPRQQSLIVSNRAVQLAHSTRATTRSSASIACKCVVIVCAYSSHVTRPRNRIAVRSWPLQRHSRFGRLPRVCSRHVFEPAWRALSNQLQTVRARQLRQHNRRKRLPTLQVHSARFSCARLRRCCSAGKFNPSQGSTRADACRPCAAGSFSEAEGQSGCTLCNVGSSKRENGSSTECTP